MRSGTSAASAAIALSGAIAASLLSMVASMPKSKTNAVAEREALDEANTEIVKLRTTLTELIDRDADAYDLVVAAFGDKGKHARTTIGVAVLPLDAAVEVEGMFEVA